MNIDIPEEAARRYTQPGSRLFHLFHLMMERVGAAIMTSAKFRILAGLTTASLPLSFAVYR